MKWEFLQDPFDTQYERKEVPPYLFSKNKRTKVSKKKEGEYSNSMFHGQIKEQDVFSFSTGLKTFDQDRREKKEKGLPANSANERE